MKNGEVIKLTRHCQIQQHPTNFVLTVRHSSLPEQAGSALPRNASGGFCPLSLLSLSNNSERHIQIFQKRINYSFCLYIGFRTKGQNPESLMVLPIHCPSLPGQIQDSVTKPLRHGRIDRILRKRRPSGKKEHEQNERPDRHPGGDDRNRPGPPSRCLKMVFLL